MDNIWKWVSVWLKNVDPWPGSWDCPPRPHSHIVGPKAVKR